MLNEHRDLLMSVQAGDCQERDCLKSECCKLVEHFFGVPDGVRSFQDSRAFVSVALLLRS